VAIPPPMRQQQTQPQPTSRRPSRTVLLLLGVIVLLLVGGAVLITRQHNVAAPTVPPALPVPTTAVGNPAVAANEVEACMRAHEMTYANEVVRNYSASTPTPPFLQSNGDPFENAVSEYSGETPTVVEFESCVWPPPRWAD
jgi:hypothetical protein